MKKKIIAILVNGELMFMSIVVLVPVVWIILSAFQSGNALGNLSLSHLTLNNFQRLFSEQTMEHGLLIHWNCGSQYMLFCYIDHAYILGDVTVSV